MVSVKHPKPLGIKQESTNYDVAASELSSPLCSIIDAVSVSSKEEKTKNKNSFTTKITKEHEVV